MGTGECEWHECPCVGEWVVARLRQGDEHDVFVHFAGPFICHGRVAGRTRETRGKVNKGNFNNRTQDTPLCR